MAQEKPQTAPAPALDQMQEQAFPELTGAPATPAPATETNQAETQKAIDLRKDIEEEQAKLERTFGKKPSFTEAQVSLVERLAAEDRKTQLAQQEEQQKQEQLALEERAQANADIERYKAAKQKAAELGINFQEDTDAESLIMQQQQEQERLQLETQQQEQLSKEMAKLQMEQEQRSGDAAELQAEQELQKNRIRPQLAANQIIERAEQEQATQRQQTIDQQLAQIEKEREALANQPFQSYWSKQSTGNKVLAGIAMAMGALGAAYLGRTDNQAANIILKAVDQDLEQQKLSREDKFRAMDRQLQGIKLKISEKSQRIQDQIQKAQLRKLYQEIDARQQANQNERIKAALLAQGKELPASMLSQEQTKAAGKLRDEYNKQSKDLGTAEIISQYKQIQQFSRDPSPAGDIGLVFSYMKVLDPRSVVREGEFATAQNAGGIPDKVRAMYNKVVNGKRLSENQRKDFAGQAEKIVSSKLKTQKLINRRYTNLSQQYGVPSSLVVQKYDMNEIAELSDREKLIQREMRKNPKLKKSKVEQNIDSLVERGLLDPIKFGK